MNEAQKRAREIRTQQENIKASRAQLAKEAAAAGVGTDEYIARQRAWSPLG